MGIDVHHDLSRLSPIGERNARALDRRKLYAEKINKPETIVRRGVEEFLPKESLSPDQLSGVDSAMAEAVKLKFLEKPLTKDELAEFIKIPPRGS